MCQREIPRERWNFILEGNIKGKCRMQLQSSYLIENKELKKNGYYSKFEERMDNKIEKFKG
jgi:hypothetical protein